MITRLARVPFARRVSKAPLIYMQGVLSIRRYTRRRYVPGWKRRNIIANFLLFVGAIGIGIWFLSSVSGFVDSGTSPVYAVFFFVPICGVFLVVVVLVEVVNSLSGSKKRIGIEW